MSIDDMMKSAVVRLQATGQLYTTAILSRAFCIDVMRMRLERIPKIRECYISVKC